MIIVVLLLWLILGFHTDITQTEGKSDEQALKRDFLQHDADLWVSDSEERLNVALKYTSCHYVILDPQTSYFGRVVYDNRDILMYSTPDRVGRRYQNMLPRDTNERYTETRDRSYYIVKVTRNGGNRMVIVSKPRGPGRWSLM